MFGPLADMPADFLFTLHDRANPLWGLLDIWIRQIWHCFYEGTRYSLANFFRFSGGLLLSFNSGYFTDSFFILYYLFLQTPLS